MNLGQVMQRYLEEVLLSTPAPASAQVLVPSSPRRIQTVDLERALDDPRTLFAPADHDELKERLRVLVHFALWLGDSPPGYLPRRFASRAARLRFHVWSLPARMGWPPEWRSLKVAWSTVETPRDDDRVVLSQELVLAEARVARDDWLAYLNTWEDDPWLATRHQHDPNLLESDLWWLTMTWPRPRRGAQPWPGEPSYLNLEAEGTKDHSTYQRVASDLAELHWLPRGALHPAAYALLPQSRFARLLPWVFPLTTLVIVGLFAGTLVSAAAWSGLGLLGAGVALAATAPSRLTGLALLRVPAAAAVGLVVLLSLTSRWWLAPWGWTVGAGLLVLAAFYLMLESRLHGAGLRAYPRGILLAAIAAGYAFVLSLVAFAFVAPVVADHGECLTGWWSANPWSARTLPPSCADLNGGRAQAPAGVLLLMTGWSLAGGLAAQILWDDRPLTAPLGRLRRVRGGTR